MPHVIVLGSGTSNGVPTPGREYAESFLANPKNHRTRPSIVLCGPTGNVLVDCAPELRLQLLREKIGDIEACLITHTHADHIMGMDDLRSFCLKTGKAMPVYTSPRYQADIKRIFNYAFEDFGPEIWVPRFDLKEVPETLHLGGLELKTFWVDHGDWPVLAFRVGGFAYLTDVNHIPEKAMEQLHDLDVLILDAVRYRPHPNHFHYDKAIEVAQEIGAKRTYFTHLSDDYDHDITNSELPDGIELAYDGLYVSL